MKYSEATLSIPEDPKEFLKKGVQVATYRPIHISYWQDKFVLKLTPEQKYFYLYLMTNSKTKQCGIYELPKNVISFETGYNLETINKLLKHFSEFKKISYDEETEEIFIRNWVKFNQIDNKNIFICVAKELKEIKSKTFLKEFAKCVENMNTNGEYTKEIVGTCKGLARVGVSATKKETETETESQSIKEFVRFWDLYGKKVGNKDKICTKFYKLNAAEREQIFKTLPDYILSTPDIQYRKNPETYLNNKSWNDDIIIKDNLVNCEPVNPNIIKLPD